MKRKEKKMIRESKKKKFFFGDFPDGPVVQTPCSQCGGVGGMAGTGLIPGQGTKMPHAVQPKKKKQKNLFSK